MSWFSDELHKIGAFLDQIFKDTRPGLEKFLADHRAQALTVVEGIGKDFIGQPLSAWKEIAFNDVKAALPGAPSDTAISILTELAQDVYKNRQQGAATGQGQ